MCANPKLPRGLLRAAAVCLIIVAALVVGRFAILGERAAGTVSDLACTAPHHDFGLVPLARAGGLKHVFIVENASDKTIRVTKVVTSCGCTTANPDRMAMQPKSTTSIPVQVDWSGRSGEQHSFVDIYTDDKSTPLSLTVSAVIKQSAAISPRVLDFGYISPDTRREKVFEVSPGPAENAIHIERVDVSNPEIVVRRISASDDATAESPAQFGVCVRPSGGNATDLFGKVLVKIQGFEYPRVVRIRARSTGAILSEPPSAVLEPDARAVGLHVEILEAGTDCTISTTVEPKRLADALTVSVGDQRRANGRLWASLTIKRVGLPAFAAGHIRLTAGPNMMRIPVVILASDNVSESGRPH